MSTENPTPPSSNPPSSGAQRPNMAASTDDKSKMFMIIAGVLAVALIAVAIWAASLKSAVSDADAQNAQQQAQIDSLQQQLAATKTADSTKISGLEQKLANAKGKIDNLRTEVGVDKKSIAQSTQELKAAKRAYAKANAAAVNEENNLKLQVAAADSKAKLATECAQVAYHGLALAYSKFTDETYADTVLLLNKANKVCKTVLTETPVS